MKKAEILNLNYATQISEDSLAYLLNKFNKKILFICQDDTNQDKLIEQIKFFSPNKKVILLPNWDNLPYSNNSPSRKNSFERINAFIELLTNKDSDNLCLITNLPSLTKRISLESYNKFILINQKQSIDRNNILDFLNQNGYQRHEVASEVGDYAVRGDIIDIVCNEEKGWRIDFFGSQIEKIRTYDCYNQISQDTLSQIKITPINEIILNQITINNFKKNFEQYFGLTSNENPLYQSVCDGRYFQGIENYLPLFFEETSSIFDFFKPEIILAASSLQNDIEHFINSIDQHYQARIESNKKNYRDEIFAYPLPPTNIWLTKHEIYNHINKSNVVLYHPFNLDYSNIIEAFISPGENFFQKSKSNKVSVYDLLKKFRDNNKKKLVICCKNDISYERIKSILEANNFYCYKIKFFEDCHNISGKTIGITILNIDQSFNTENFSFISEQDLFGEKIYVKKSTNKIDKLLAQINNLKAGEYVVHREHGIALFSGLETLEAGGLKNDYLKLMYHDGDILYIPIVNFDVLTRYGSSNNIPPILDKLGGVSWLKKKEKLKEKLLEIANNLVNIAAQRSTQHGEILIPEHRLYQEFCSKFPYVETEDQLASIQSVEQDLASGIPMDRLICGDVGFGKTEIAMRTAFIACFSENHIKKQVAIIVPTTLLARQHYNSFIKRFEGFNVNIKQLSRLVSSKEASLTKQELADGAVDIVIGTHSILAKNLKFANLGLLIIDEEHHFGVLQKEKLKEIQQNVHILTLSATPIPRTLQMSLTGLRDLSLIATPPINRQVVKSYIMHFDPLIIREAILREYNRGGQIFFVCPRISEIDEVYPKLQELVPEIKICITHGQMKPSEIEEIINNFYLKKFDLLLSTTIIESGIDISAANTIFIYRSDKLGLAALYQLRGRVGRSNVKAYSYLLIPNKKLNDLSKSRLEVMQTIDSLGAGFTIASHDMDNRGFGNLVGDEQSGHIKEIGIELYQEMLQEAISDLKNKDNDQTLHLEDFSPQINISAPVTIPAFYVQDLNLRLSLYRTLANSNDDFELEKFASEMIDRFGQYPSEVKHLISVISIKILCKKIGIEKIDVGEKVVVFLFRNFDACDRDKLFKYFEQNQSYIKIKPNNKMLVNKTCNSTDDKINFIKQILYSIPLKTHTN